MERLTTETPDGNFETILNFVYGRYGWAYIRYDGENEDVPLTDWARKQCLNRGCDEFPAESAEEIDQEICDCMMDCPDCPAALSYCFASQAVHLRDRLKRYEDILFAADGTELISLEQLRTMVSQLPNPPLTLEELREMDGEPVWVVPLDGQEFEPPESDNYMEAHWMINHAWRWRDYDAERGDYGKTWLAYRKKPEEGSHTPVEPAVPDWAWHLHSRFMRTE